MTFKSEYQFILDLKKMFEDYYKLNQDENKKNYIHIKSNIYNTNIDNIINNSKLCKHSGNFFENIYVYIYNDDKTIDLNLTFRFDYIKEKRFFFFLKKDCVFNLRTTLEGNVYSRKFYDVNEYKNTITYLNEFKRMEDIIKYIINLYNKYHIKT